MGDQVLQYTKPQKAAVLPTAIDRQIKMMVIIEGYCSRMKATHLVTDRSMLSHTATVH